ncbi:helix-turn-helix domain-containing protein [Streptomyces sp. KR55]|uniref:helix-turn-helix domain-containing protein n=1 Tax=Streptomyces sp. KR55 TaxID=3457425 RepID=UPI003FD4402A
MGNQGESSLNEAQDAVGFIKSMRQLKERSGLTYRELEERAARNGDVLARSTLSDVLRRTNLPRPEMLAAFVRACGEGQRVDLWLDARDQIAARTPDVPATASGSSASDQTDENQPPHLEHRPQPQDAEVAGIQPRRFKGRTVALASTLIVPLLAVVAWGLIPDDSDTANTQGSPTGGWVTIHPARTPDLCLTDGRDRDGAYDHAVAVQLPCAQITVPRTYLEPAGESLYRIQWHHPQEGKGCLTVMSTGEVKGMLEPRNDCAHATLFRLEPVSTDETGGFRIRPANSSRCLGLVDDDTVEGAEAIEEPCTGADDQRFLVRTG